MTEHYPFNPTPEQRRNLKRLAMHLDLGVTNYAFDMADYQREDPDCGTVACACGHGPSLGIEKKADEEWMAYADRAFGTSNIRVSDWFFGPDWAQTDNSAKGAATRIRYALKCGIPEDAEMQMCGEAPLSYTIPANVEGPVITVKEKEDH